MKKKQILNKTRHVCLPRGSCRLPPPPPSPHLSHLRVTLGGGWLCSCCRSFFSRFISRSLFVCFFSRWVGVWGGGGTYPSSANMGSRLALALRSVWFAVVLGALQLHLQPLHADLEAVHGLDGRLCRHGIVVADEAW